MQNERLKQRDNKKKSKKEVNGRKERENETNEKFFFQIGTKKLGAEYSDTEEDNGSEIKEREGQTRRNATIWETLDELRIPIPHHSNSPCKIL